MVPVFRPKEGFDELIASLDRQTLGSDEFEVILCDDGSGEPTGERLAEVARTRPNVRVLTLPPTGWPGTPRNHGIDTAQGEYVQFVDQDDWLYDDALERLCDYADRHSSDVVIGKVVGIGRKIPGQIFRRDVPRAELGRDPILELLTPHKMFRTSFLRRNGIRFPDGKVRLEDHLFVMEAYFRADTISILASTPCYAWVKNAGSASSSRIDPETYFPHLESVFELVEANTRPGAVRDKLLRHWYRGKILKRMDGRRMVRYPDDYRETFLNTVTPIAQRWFGPGVVRGLAFPLRIRSALLTAERRDDLLRLAEFDASLRCRADVTGARWTRGGRLEMTLRIRITDGVDDALVFDTEGRWQPPEGIGEGVLSPEILDAHRDLRHDRIELAIRDSTDKTERRGPSSRMRRMTAARAAVVPVRLFGREETSSGGQLVAHVRHAGWTFETRVRADPSVLRDIGRSPVLAGASCRLVTNDDGTIELRRGGPSSRTRDLIARTVDRATGAGHRIVARARITASRYRRR